MALQHYTPMSENAFFSFGGFTCVRPREWNTYLNQVASQNFPQYDQALSGKWRENDCVLQSLKKYLFYEFGVFLPEQTLFPAYNPAGEGINPIRMVEVITALIEPLGFEVEEIIVPDENLRQALGDQPPFVDGSHARDFHNKPGICVINLRPGYGHAFFWDQINARKFTSEKFRMAIRIRRKVGQDQELSAINGLDVYARLIKNTVLRGRMHSSDQAAVLVSAIDGLVAYVQSAEDRQGGEFRQCVDMQVSGIAAMFAEGLHGTLTEDDRLLLDMGEMVRQIFRDAPVIA